MMRNGQLTPDLVDTYEMSEDAIGPITSFTYEGRSEMVRWHRADWPKMLSTAGRDLLTLYRS